MVSKRDFFQKHFKNLTNPKLLIESVYKMKYYTILINSDSRTECLDHMACQVCVAESQRCAVPGSHGL